MKIYKKYYLNVYDKLNKMLMYPGDYLRYNFTTEWVDSRVEYKEIMLT